MSSKTYLTLGRAGDCLNIFPILHQDFLQNGQKSNLVISQQYADLCDGVTYINPLIFKGSFCDVEGAMKQFKGTLPTQVMGDGEFISSQVYGDNLKVPQSCDSFQKEAWRLAGKLDQWRFQHPLVFDNRSPEREEALLAKYTKRFKKARWIVVADGGHSSPFPYRELLRHLLELRFNRTCDIIYLDQIKAHRFYDLLCILDHPKTRCIVATDSGPLHLSYATKKPVVALVTDKPSLWHGSAFRGQHVGYCRYSKFPESAVSILDTIASLGDAGTYMPPGGLTRLIHAYSEYPCDAETHKRNQFAKATWEAEYSRSVGWFSTPLTDSHVTRSSVDLIKEGKPFPVVLDLLRIAALRAQEKDIIVFSNSDTCWAPGITAQIIEACEKSGGCHAHRRDFNELTKPLEASEVAKGVHYPGSDLFAFTKPFLRKILPEFGDYICGFELWDRILRELVKKHGGVELQNQIYHQTHESLWFRERVAHPINKWNRRLGKQWLIANNLPLEEISQFKD